MDFKEIRRSLSKLAIPNLTLYIVMGQTVFYVFEKATPGFLNIVVLIPELVLRGEVWRLLSFLFVPPMANPLFLAFGLYLFYIMGTALEHMWGVASYNAYLLIGYLATVAVAFIFPGVPATNVFIGSSVFLGFAMLFPDFEIILFMILPVKVKWLAMIDGVLLLMAFFSGPWQIKALIGASMINFLLFFRREIVQHVSRSKRQMETRALKVESKDKPLHVCAACGITDKTHRQMDFRYCPGCGGKLAYCTEHLNNHEHRIG